jgi:sortase (surface protein transpeptidase)
VLSAAGVIVAVLVLSAVLAQRGLFTSERLVARENGPVAEQDVATVEQEAADPTGVRIPALDVNAATIPLGLRSDGSIEVPQDFAQTGWWRDGPEPGELGAAVILGHVDSYEGPAVFYGLEALQAGDPIHIDRADGSTVTYVVERVEQHPKDNFPTVDVYGPTQESELRLVTCGGTFDREARSYRDNVIVFAVAQA